MSWTMRAALCAVVILAMMAPVRADVSPAAAETRGWVDTVTQPVDWLTWGADLRVRQEYLKNAIDFNSAANDNRSVIRVRGRVWLELGPFFRDEMADYANGLSLYTRLATEPRFYQQHPGTVPKQDWDEYIIDNLYLNWLRVLGAPISLKVGRQDMVYGRGWIILDGTPLDGSRTIYSDAAKATLHFDAIKTNLDLFVIDNKARQSTLPVVNGQGRYVSEYDARLFGAYLISQFLKPQGIGEVHAYYIYKDEDRVAPQAPAAVPISANQRIVHTLGALVQGKVLSNLDYYLEGAGQWGRNDGNSRAAYGFNSDVGYTFAEAPWTPRIHGAYEYLSGDNKRTSTMEGWDPVLARWPQWSELFAYRWAGELSGLAGYHTNLQRFNVGVSAKPIAVKDAARLGVLGLFLDYNFLLGNTSHYNSGTGVFGEGDTRGHLYVARVHYTLPKPLDSLATHLWAEYFVPGSYYNSTADDALFFRWEVLYTFKNSRR